MILTDALHSQHLSAQTIEQDCGADYLMTVKGNQKGLRNELEKLHEAHHDGVFFLGLFRPGGPLAGAALDRPPAQCPPCHNQRVFRGNEEKQIRAGLSNRDLEETIMASKSVNRCYMNQS